MTRRMRILIYGINYHPELVGIGKYTGEMAVWLASKGHEVRVVTAPPYYPMWKVGEGWSAWRYGVEVTEGVKVYRCPLLVPERPTGAKRMLHLMSFAVTSLPVALIQGLTWRPDVVLAVEPPVFCAPAALATAALGGSRSWLHIQDFELDAAFSLGLLRSNFARRLAERLERALMGRFRRVSTISRGMMARLAEKGVDEGSACLFPNWVDTGLIRPMEGPSPFRAELGAGEEDIVCLYSGNMGEKQGIEILIEAAERVSADGRLRFVLCGEGAARERLEKRASGLENVTFLPLQPIERLNDLLNLADIHLLPQRGDVADLVMPSKLLGIFASGRPVVATANQGTQLAAEVEGRGIVVPPGDAGALARAVVKLARDPSERKRLGTAAREHCISFWDISEVLGRFEQEAALRPATGKNA